MKNIYREYFYIPKDKHMTTKVFTTHVVLSVVSVLACTLAMFASSYAWFSMDVTSTGNVVESTYFDTHEESIRETVELEDDHIYVAKLAADDEHVFKLTSEGAKTGYCIVTLEYEDAKGKPCAESFYTDLIPAGGHLMLGIKAAAETVITFEPYWGELEYNESWDGMCYGETTKPAIRKFSVRRASAESRVGEYIPGPTTMYLEYQFPQYAILEDVAAFYMVNVEDILIFNGLDAIEDVEIGDWINIPYVEPDAEIYVAMPEDIEHLVQEGETVETIAMLYDISVEELIDYNGLMPVIEEELSGEEGAPIEDVDEDEALPYFEDAYGWRYVLTPGDILLIPFEAETGYTPTEVVYEKDLMVDGTDEPEEDTEDWEDWEYSDDNWDEFDSFLPDDKQGSDEEPPTNENEQFEEDDPSDSGAILIIDGWPVDGGEELQEQETEEQEPVEEEFQEQLPEGQQGGLLG